MNKIFKQISAGLSAWRESCRTQCAGRRTRRIEKEAMTALQVMEFNGDMYLSYHGVPVLSAKHATVPLTEAVSHSRETFKAWMEARLWEK